MLLIPATHESGALCAFDAEKAFVILDIGDNKTIIQNNDGFGVTLLHPFSEVIAAIRRAEGERGEE